MADALERVTNLLALLLETRRPLTLTQIASELNGQYPTGDGALRGAFERDKSMLRSVGVPIDQEVLAGNQAGQTVYIIDRSRYELDQLDLSQDEQRALQMAVAAVHSDESWGRDGLWKLGVGGQAQPLSVSANLPTLRELPLLREATAARATVSFSYRSTKRALDPYGLLLRSGLWYLVGFDHAHSEVRTYRVDRIEGEVEVGSGQSFDRPDGFDIRLSFPADPKLIGEPEAQHSVALVRIVANRAALVARELGADAIQSHNADGSIDVLVPCVNRDAFRAWLLGMTVNAIVLEPEDVRSEVILWLQSLANGLPVEGGVSWL
jgi:proteasome accessory factor B